MSHKNSVELHERNESHELNEPSKLSTEPNELSLHGETCSAQALAFGLNAEELKKFTNQLGRMPSTEELAVCGALWSEHCSYKSSKVHLRRFHTQEDWVWQGPGENAGVVGITQNWGIAFKMESHNHPSYIEPYQGAATGVGGILRDVFCMGARPIANLNCLRFGEGRWNAHLLKRTVEGIADYGNSVGVPTVGGDTSFHPGYSKNILVNAFTAGVIHRNSIFKGVLQESSVKETNTVTPSSHESQPKLTAGQFKLTPGQLITEDAKNILFPKDANLLVYFGQPTGRDGVHGATMSSSEFSAGAATLKPTVQVGDPFAERKLLLATEALIRSQKVVGLQDMGAAGLTSSSVEMAGRSGCGVALWLNQVPQRAANMQPFEILLSESQERMLCAVKQEDLAFVQETLAPWDVEVAVVGSVNHTGQFVCVFDNRICTAIPIAALVDDIPLYHWPLEDEDSYKKRQKQKTQETALFAHENHRDKKILGLKQPNFAKNTGNLAHEFLLQVHKQNLGAVLETAQQELANLLASPIFANRFPIQSHYCSTVQGNTVAGAGAMQDGSAAVVRLPRWAQETPEAQVGIALSAGCEERWVEMDPFHGAIHSALKLCRKIVACGGHPLALTDCLNYGSPKNPAVMRQLASSIDGISAFAKFFQVPVVSGNVSLNNQTDGEPIPPTPMLGVVGKIADVTKVRLSRLSPEKRNFKTADLLWINSSTLQSSLSFTCGAVPFVLEQVLSHLPPVNMPEEKNLWRSYNGLLQKVTVTLSQIVGTGGAMFSALKLAFQNHLNLSFCPDFLNLPAHLAFAEGQAGFLLAVPPEELAEVQAYCLQHNLVITQVAKLTQIPEAMHESCSTRILPAHVYKSPFLAKCFANWSSGINFF